MKDGRRSNLKYVAVMRHASYVKRGRQVRTWWRFKTSVLSCHVREPGSSSSTVFKLAKPEGGLCIYMCVCVIDRKQYSDGRGSVPFCYLSSIKKRSIRKEKEGKTR